MDVVHHAYNKTNGSEEKLEVHEETEQQLAIDSTINQNITLTDYNII